MEVNEGSMDEKIWDLKVLRESFNKRHGDGFLSDLNNYLNTLYWKRWRVEYHSKAESELWEKLMSNPVIKASDAEFQYTIEAVNAEAEAMIFVLHSMGDILAQAVNVAVLGGNKLDEGRVSLDSLIDHLKKNSIANEVVEALESFKNSTEFIYISDASNTLKHRKLIKVNYGLSIKIGEESRDGVRLLSFQYRDNVHEDTWVEDIKIKHRKKIFDLTVDVGNQVNHYLC